MAMLALLLAAAAPAWLSPQPDRRAVLRSAGGAALLSLSPLPALARSKEKAEEKAIQKATAKEARQAMREYKYAPRPELVGSLETGYTYKEGTVKAGSTGELASYFTEKGATIQAEYAGEKARARGLSAEEAKKAALEKAAAEKKARKAREPSEDELRIRAFCEKNKDLRDQMGRPVCQ
ncbi:hypothetical protein AB1Y20_010260 [Prymnesium parvum]|uniref:PSI-F n=1 Tax=Prymnesium parvum TaxID=97485 RepID=A0AB34K6P2_PRYPA